MILFTVKGDAAAVCMEHVCNGKYKQKGWEWVKLKCVQSPLDGDGRSCKHCRSTTKSAAPCGHWYIDQPYPCTRRLFTYRKKAAVLKCGLNAESGE